MFSTNFICECGERLKANFMTFDWFILNDKKNKDIKISNFYTIKNESTSTYLHCDKCKNIYHIYLDGTLNFSVSKTK